MKLQIPILSIIDFSNRVLFFTLLHLFIFSTPMFSNDDSVSSPQPKLEELKEEVDMLKRKVEFLQNKIDSNTNSESKEELPSQKNEDSDDEIENSTEKSPNSHIYSNARAKGITIQGLGGENVGKRYAIVVGINKYSDISISNLNKARNDAIVMAKILESKGQFDKVFLMTDDIDNKGIDRNLYPTRLNILAKVDAILNFLTPNDMFLFFFSGHGISDYDEKGYLITVDTLSEHKFNSSLKVEELVSRLKKKKLKKSLLILDACREKIYSSKSADQSPLRQEKFSEAEVAATFYSTKAGYYSYEDEDSDFGVFTKYLVYGIEGKADFNQDGVVTFSELQAFVQDQVRNWSLKNNKKQKPFVKIYGETYGDLVLSLTPTVLKDGESLADQKIPKKTRLPYVWRSTVLPGWGQYHDGSTTRGIAYMSMGVFSGYYYLTNLIKLNQYQSQYNSSFTLPGSLLLPTSLDQQFKKNALSEQESLTKNAYLLFMGFWLWNIYDAAVFEKQDGFRFWDFAIYQRSVPNYYSDQTIRSSSETFGTFQFQMKF